MTENERITIDDFDRCFQAGFLAPIPPSRMMTRPATSPRNAGPIPRTLMPEAVTRNVVVAAKCRFSSLSPA